MSISGPGGFSRAPKIILRRKGQESLRSLAKKGRGGAGVRASTPMWV